MGLIDEISIKRIHIDQKKRLEDIFYLFAYEVNDLSHIYVLIIFETMNVLMTVDVSQNFDQIESILYLFLYFFKYLFFSRF